MPEAAPHTVPPALLRKDAHVYVAKQKVALAKKFVPTKMDALFAALDIAVELFALGREDEALELAEDVGRRVTFTGNYNLWTPAAYAVALAARVRRTTGDTAGAKALVARLVENPAYARVPRGAIADKVAGLRRDLDATRAEASQKWACQKLTRALAVAVYFRETAGHGFFYDEWIAPAELDAFIDDARALLRERLG